MLNVGIVGLGAISSAHLQAVRSVEAAQLTAACDLIPERAKLVPEANFYTDITEMLEREHLDVLHICVPHHLHVPFAKMAAGKGVNVFLEKPPALNCRELEELKSLEADCSIKLGICLQNRYNRTTLFMRQAIHEETYGLLCGCKATVTWNRKNGYYDRDPWRGRLSEAGGGVMLSQAIHTLDLLCFLFGEAEWVKGRIDNLLLEDIEVEDTASAYIQFAKGVAAIFHGSVIHSFDSPVEVELVFEDVRLSMRNGKLFLFRNGEQSVVAEDALIRGTKSYYGSGHSEAISRFYTAVVQDTEDYIHTADAEACMKLIDGIVLSSEEGLRIPLAPRG
jgi:UDP-N-acetyl-2-amino-2-deoxyglucuronate dehydrogenase